MNACDVDESSRQSKTRDFTITTTADKLRYQRGCVADASSIDHGQSDLRRFAIP